MFGYSLNFDEFVCQWPLLARAAHVSDRVQLENRALTVPAKHPGQRRLATARPAVDMDPVHFNLDSIDHKK